MVIMYLFMRMYFCMYIEVVHTLVLDHVVRAELLGAGANHNLVRERDGGLHAS